VGRKKRNPGISRIRGPCGPIWPLLGINPRKPSESRKICRGTPRDATDTTTRGFTQWDPATGKLTGITFTDPFFGDGVWKKLAVRQEGNRVTYGGFYPIPNAAVVLGGGGTPQQRCLAGAYAEVNNGLTEARDTASRSTFPSMTKPDGVTQGAWNQRMCQELKAARAALDRAKGHKRRANAQNQGKNGGVGDPGVTMAIKHLCWELERAEAALTAAEAAKGG
jgi:hypothetical protein